SPDDVPAVGGEHARDHREEPGTIRRTDREFAERTVTEVTDRAGEPTPVLVELANQLRVLRERLLGRRQEVARGHGREHALERFRDRPFALGNRLTEPRLHPLDSRFARLLEELALLEELVRPHV